MGCIGELASLHAALDLSYEIRVRSSPGELSGVWRIPDANPNAQNFYLVVEAIVESEPAKQELFHTLGAPGAGAEQ